MNRVKLIIVLLLCCLLLTSCVDSKEPTISKNGEMLFLTGDQMSQEEREGFFVMNKDATFTPVMNAAQGYQGDNTNTDKSAIPTRYLWFTNNQINISSLIPVVTKDTPLVAVYNADGNMPSVYTLEKYTYKGYTIGCHIYRDEDDTLYLSARDSLSGSDAEAAMENLNQQDVYTISEINQGEILPINNVDNNMQMILGLEKNKLYEFRFYSGTKYATFTAAADTLVLQSEGVTVLQNPYRKTKEGYFVINLPDNLKPGYYYICGQGMFKYQG